MSSEKEHLRYFFLGIFYFSIKEKKMLLRLLKWFIPL